MMPYSCPQGGWTADVNVPLREEQTFAVIAYLHRDGIAHISGEQGNGVFRCLGWLEPEHQRIVLGGRPREVRRLKFCLFSIQSERDALRIHPAHSVALQGGTRCQVGKFCATAFVHRIVVH